MTQMIKGYLCVIGSAVVFGCMPLGAKIIYANGVNPVSLVSYRNILSLPVIFLILKAGKEMIFFIQLYFIRCFNDTAFCLSGDCYFA